MAPDEAGMHHGCGDLSGVNGTPLLRGVEFTHAPAEAGKRMGEAGLKGKPGTFTKQQPRAWDELL